MNREHKKLLHGLKLKKWAEKNPHFPPNYIPKTVYKDSTANGLTKAIIDYINLHGYQAERINTMGVARTKYRTDGSVAGVQWTKGTGTPGSADISATIKGRSVKIEVKIGKDRQSDAIIVGIVPTVNSVVVSKHFRKSRTFKNLVLDF